MKKDICEHCRKDVNKFSDGVIHGFIDITENVERRRRAADSSPWWKIVGGNRSDRRAEIECGIWCNRECLEQWIASKLYPMANKAAPLAVAFALLSMAVLAGCSRSPVWVERHVPTSDAEREAVAAMVEKVLAATPATLSGHDQDWDDAIAEAKRTAQETRCRPTYWERAPVAPYSENWDYTGRWRYGIERGHRIVDGVETCDLKDCPTCNR